MSAIEIEPRINNLGFVGEREDAGIRIIYQNVILQSFGAMRSKHLNAGLPLILQVAFQFLTLAIVSVQEYASYPHLATSR